MKKVSGLYLEREEVKRRLFIPGEGGDGRREGGRRSIPGEGGGDGKEVYTWKGRR